MTEDSEGGLWLSSTRGIYRLHKDHLEKMVDGRADAGIVRIAPDVFLATVGDSSGTLLTKADAVRIVKDGNGWKSETIIPTVGPVQFRVDHAGNVLYGCLGGFCEISVDALIRWHSGQPLPITRHAIKEGVNYAGDASVVLRDRFGCVWFRNSMNTAYQCSSDSAPTRLPPELVSQGFPLIFELPGGAIVIPSFSELATGRP